MGLNRRSFLSRLGGIVAALAGARLFDVPAAPEVPKAPARAPTREYVNSLPKIYDPAPVLPVPPNGDFLTPAHLYWDIEANTTMMSVAGGHYERVPFPPAAAIRSEWA